MLSFELPTKRRIEEIFKSRKYNISRDDLMKLYYAFEDLSILSDHPTQEMMRKKEIAFDDSVEKYKEKMDWLNKFMKSKGFEENMFRNPSNFRISAADYDYYYELKTEKQLIKEEAERNGMKEQ